MRYYFKCPHCGNDERFTRAREESRLTGCFIFALGGFLPALLFADHTYRRIVCMKCAYIFRQPTPRSAPLAVFAGWMSALTIVCVLITVLVYVTTDVAESLPQIRFLAAIEQAVGAHPRAVIYLVALLVSLLLFTCFVVVITSNSKRRKELGNKFLLEPPDSPVQAGHAAIETSDSVDGDEWASRRE